LGFAQQDGLSGFCFAGFSRCPAARQQMQDQEKVLTL